MDTSVLGKISSRYFATGVKNKNLAGRSGIEVLAVGFSRIGTLKKHAPLVCNYNHVQILGKKRLFMSTVRLIAAKCFLII